MLDLADAGLMLVNAGLYVLLSPHPKPIISWSCFGLWRARQAHHHGVGDVMAGLSARTDLKPWITGLRRASQRCSNCVQCHNTVSADFNIVSANVNIVSEVAF